jgi:FlgD Ig-like domain
LKLLKSVRFRLLLLILGGAASFSGSAAASDVDADNVQPTVRNAQLSRELRERSPATAVASNPRDTVFVGYTPGHTDDNHWSIWSGSDKLHDGGPYRRPPAQGGMWDFEGPYPHGDSLQGWTPVRMQMSGTGGLSIPDYQRPWRCLDYGNEASSVIPGTTRTGGVVGVWHVDRGDLQTVPTSVDDQADAVNGAGSGVGGVNWTPLQGGSSAWMGLRRHGDASHLDDVARGGTGNAFNEDVMVYNHLSTSVANGGTDKRYPGYGDHMDQMLYRDIEVSGANTLTVGFRYQTRMATGFSTNSLTRSGWFQWDPLTVSTGVPNANFIASSGNPTPPIDSFMVYVGAPAESVVVLSDGALHPIFDRKRRWAGEVFRGNEGLYTQILSVSGTRALTDFTATVSESALTIIRSASAAGVTDVVRLVFRVKTNQSFSDESVLSAGSSSNGIGAVVLDSVRVAIAESGPIVLGLFESPDEIDNSTGYGPYGNRSHPHHPLNTWKSTGKPAKVYTHAHPMAGDAGRGYIPLLYEDLCGQPGDPSRICDLLGVVVSAGDHDYYEASGGPLGTAEQEPFDGMYSPTINLSGQGVTTRLIDGAITPVNSMGLSVADADASEDYYFDYEIYTGRFDILTTGSAWRIGVLNYPSAVGVAGTNEYPRWGQIRLSSGMFTNPDKACFRDLLPLRGLGLIRTTKASGIPDSMRLNIHVRQETYRFGLPSSEHFGGCYWDNLSLAIVDGVYRGPVSVDPWHLFQDTFPVTENNALVGYTAAFDTTVGLLKTGLNIAPTTGTTQRFNVPGDTTVVIAPGTSVRVDLVFRILPGPGNYVNPGAPPTTQVLRRVPTSDTPIDGAVVGSSNFWENYMGDRGAKGAGAHPSPRWSPHVWNAARMDTAEIQVFQQQKRIAAQPTNSGLFMSTYHEEELASPYRRALAIPRNICFVADTAQFSLTTRVVCGSGMVPGITLYPPVWAFAPGSGLATEGNGDPLASPSQIQSCPGPAGNGFCKTIEGTKILPDGWFTPGTHVTYFFRREDLPPATSAVSICPDTTIVSPQPGEGSTDAHRWQEVSVLPDRWKDSDYLHPVLGTPGAGEACVLLIDLNDRRGNEHVFIGIADSLGMNAASKRGGSNGWSAPGGADINDHAYFVRRHVGQAGTTFDKYDVKASESSITRAGSLGSRYGYSAQTNTQIHGKRSRQGPSPTMLAGFYRVLVTLTGDLSSGVWGPFANQGADDVGLMIGFAMTGDDLEPNRGLYTIGSGWNEAATGDALTFVNTILGVGLAHRSYLHRSGNAALIVDLTPTSALPSATGSIYGVRNSCRTTIDVATAVDPDAAVASTYEDPFSNGPHAAGILKPHTPLSPWIALSDGWDLEDLVSRDGLSTRGRLHYFESAFQDAFAVIAGCNVVGTPLVTTDTPNNSDGRRFNFTSLRNNPVREGSATFVIGLARRDRVTIRIFDVAGRLVRTLADREFAAGEHSLVWDGVDGAGHSAPRGVYFAKFEYAAQRFESRGKLVLLK